jgi:CHASE3 domain sensor protein
MDASDDVRTRVLRLTIAYVAVLLLVLGVVVGVAVKTRADNVSDARAVSQLLSASQGLKGALVDQETGARGYVLTGDERFLRPYVKGSSDATRLFEQLSRYFGDDTASREAIDLVDRRLERWRRTVAQPEIDATRRGDRAAAIAVETSGAGRTAFDSIRTALDRLDARLDANRRERLDRITTSTSVLLVVAILVGAFAAVFVVLFARSYRRWGSQRLAADEERSRRALADERDRRWIVSIAQLSERLNRADSVDAVARLIAEEAARPVDGRFVHLGLVNADGDLRMIYDRDFAAIETAPTLRHRGERTPLPEALRTRHTIVIGNGPGAIPMDGVSDFASLARHAGVETVTASPLVQGNGQIVGALGILWDRDVVIDELMRSRLDEVTTLATEAIRRAMLFDRADQLAEVSRRLSAAVSEDQVGHLVAEQICDVFEGKVANLAVVQSDGASVALFRHEVVDRQLQRRRDVIPLSVPTPLNEAIWSGAPVVMETIDSLGDDDSVPVREMRRLGVEAALSMPVIVRGRVVGAIGLGWARPQVVDPADATVSTVTELVGAALNRATVYRASTRVADFAGRLAAANSAAEIAAAVFDVVVPDILEAASGRLAVIDDEPTRLRIFHPPDSPPEFLDELATLPLATVVPVADAIRENRVVLVRDVDEIVVTWPQLVAADGPPRSAQVLAIPLHDGADSVIGSLALAWRNTHDLDAGTQALLDTVVELCGTTLERTRLYHLEHELITHMARYLTPSRASHPGLDIAGRYQPALSNLGMGGDWYDLIELADGTIGAVVGDVVGHGVTAVAEMARLKTTISTLVRTGVGVDDLFSATHEILDGPEMFRGTALYLELDPAASRLRLSSAGHPPPVLRRREGSVGPATMGSRYPVLGIDPSPVQRADPTDFACGDLVIAYTDGLVERRGETLDEGIVRLGQLVDEVGEESVDEIADAILDNLGKDATDDVALLVIRNVT